MWFGDKRSNSRKTELNYLFFKPYYIYFKYNIHI